MSNERTTNNLSNRFTNWFIGASKDESPKADKAVMVDLQSLEDRVLYSAGPIPVDFSQDAVTVDATDSAPDFLIDVDSKFELIDDSIATLEALESVSVLNTEFDLGVALGDFGDIESATEIVFVDTSVKGYEKLVDDILSQRTLGQNAEVVYLAEAQNSIRQISSVLDYRSGVSAIHLVSHGRDGELQLGGEAINLDSLDEFRSDLMSWRDSLTTDADILIYGCEVAESKVGQDFVNELSEITGADIAASSNLTGHESLGGDWVFEYQVGSIDANSVFSSSIVATWNHSLTVFDSTSEGFGTDNYDGEFEIDGTTRSVGADYHGNLTFVTSTDDASLATNGMDVLLRRVDTAGVESSIIQVNNSSVGDQKWASVAVAENGNHVVVWTSDVAGATSVWGTVYDSNGNLIKDDFQIDVTATGGDDAEVAIDSVGNFIVGWEASDGSGDGVFVQKFDTVGNTVGQTFRANDVTSGAQGNAAVAINDNGTIVVAWDEYDANDIGGASQIWVRQIEDVANHQENDALQATNSGIAANSSPSLDVDDAGNIVLGYTTDATEAFKDLIGVGFVAEGLGTGHRVLSYVQDGSNVFGIDEINHSLFAISGEQFNPVVALLDNLTYIVTWEGLGPDGYGGTDEQGVYIQTFNFNGSFHTSTAAPLLPDAVFEPGADQLVLEPSPLPLPGQNDPPSTPNDIQKSASIATFRGGTEYVAGFTGISWESGSPDDDYHWLRTSVSSDAAPTGADDTFVLLEDGSYILGEVDFGFVDADSDAFHGISISTSVGNGQILVDGVPAVINQLISIDDIQNSRVVFHPTADYSGSDSFDFHVHTEFAKSEVSNTISFTITEVNDAPETDAASQTGAENATIALTLSGSDIDGTVAHFQLKNLPSNGTVYLDAALTTPVTASTDYAATSESLTLYFVSDLNWNGTTSFDYVAVDNLGLEDATPATMTITVTDVNNRPETNAGSSGGNENAASVSISLTGFDSDGTVDSFELANLPANGQLYTDAALTNLAVAGTTYSATGQTLPLFFAPDTDWNGTTSFDYAAKDNEGLADSSPATFTINIAAGAPSTDANDDSFTGDEDSQISGSVLVNDINPSGGGLQVYEVSSPGNGDLTMNPNGTFDYVPNPGFVGTDSFEYTVGAPDSSVVHHWGLGGNATDVIGGSNGTVNGAATGAGATSEALIFDGINDYVEIPDVSYSTSFTISFKFRIDDNSGSGFQYLFNHGTVHQPDSISVFLGEAGNSGNSNTLKTVITDVDDGVGGSHADHLDVNVASFVADSSWHTYTLTIEDGDRARVYIDGVEQADSSHGQNNIDPTGGIFLGARSDLDTERFFNGGLDSLQIYDRALSSAEVGDLSNDFDVATVTIEVTGIAHDNVYGVRPGGTINVGLDSGLIYNDHDPSGSTATVVSGTTHGSVTVQPDGTFTYTHVPDGSPPASDSFVYQISDGAGYTRTATVEIHIDETGFVSSNEFLVNQDTTDDPFGNLQTTYASSYSGGGDLADTYSNSSIAVNEKGDYVVVWSSQSNLGDFDVMMRTFDFAGNPIGDQVQVNQNNSEVDGAASVAMAPDGSFVITWLRSLTNTDVMARRFDALGEPIGAEFLVSDDFNDTMTTDFNTGVQLNPTIDFNANGDFVIGWDGAYEKQNGADFYHEIMVRRFLANGTIEDVVVVNDQGGSYEEYRPSVVLLDNNDIFVVWDEQFGIHGRSVYADGTLGQEIQTPTRAYISDVRNASLATDSSGNVALAYEIQVADGLGGAQWEVHLQVFDPASPQINFTPPGNQISSGNENGPDIAFNDDGTLIMTWHGPNEADPTDTKDVFGRKFQILIGADGSPYAEAIGDQFTISQVTSGMQLGASVAALDSENFVVAWVGQDQSGSDGIFARQFGNQIATQVSGQVFEDVIGNGQKDVSDKGVDQAEVRLYRDDGSAGMDDGDRLMATVTTDSLGNYVFTGVSFGKDYFVVVDSKSVSPYAGVNTATNAENTWAEQTYGDGGAKFGGLNAGVSDNFENLSTSQHVSVFTVDFNEAAATDVDFGFSYNVVTHTQGGGFEDDDLATGRTIQGSLRQFIDNANVIAGANAMRFVPGVAATQSEGFNSWWEIAVSQALPEITDENTTIDGRAYAANGVTRLNSNAATHGAIANTGTGDDGVIGTGADGIFGTADDGVAAFDENAGVDGIVGTADDTGLTGLDAPELEIHDVLGVQNGIVVNASNVEIGYIAIHGFGEVGQQTGNIFVKADGDNAFIHDNIIGAEANSFSNPPTSANTIHNIYVVDADGGSISDNLIGFSGRSGIKITGQSDGSDDATNWTIAGNEIRSNGQAGLGHDGIDINHSSNISIINNLLIDNLAYGIDLTYSNGDITISNNTIIDNGAGALKKGGIRLFGDNNIVQHNVITGNLGAGVVVVGQFTHPTSGVTNESSTENLISENAFFNNNGLAIDLVEANATLTEIKNGDGSTTNGSSDANAGNIGLDHPVLTEAYLDGTDLHVTGTVASTSNIEFLEIYFAPAGDNEGSIFLGRLDVTSSFIYNALTGSFTAVLGQPAYGWPSGIVSGGAVSVIGVDTNSNTSEFSARLELGDLPTPVDSRVTIQEDVVFSFSLSDFLVEDTDSPTMSHIVIESLPTEGKIFLRGAEILTAGIPLTVTKAELDNEDLTFKSDPDENGQGNTDFEYASFAFRVHDGDSLSVETADMTVSVSPVNDAPTTDGVSIAGNEDDNSIAITLTGTDLDGTVASFILSGLPSDGLLFTDLGLTNQATADTSYSATGESLTLYFVPDSNWNGTTTFDFVATDNQGLDDATAATATITVSADNDAPETNSASATGIEDDASVAITLSGSDVDGTVDSIKLVGLPSDGQLYTDAGLTTLATADTSYSATGESLTLYFVPDSNWNGTTTFDFVAADNQGLDDATAATATITVSADNDAPETNSASATGIEDDTSVAITLSGSDVDGTVDSIKLVGLPSDGQLYTDAGLTTLATADTSYSATGESLTLYFVPDSNWNGTTTFDFVATDNQGLDDATAATATITVSAVNDAPVTTDQSGAGMEDGSPIVIELAGSDSDGTVQSFSIDTLPSSGKLYLDASLTNQIVAGADLAAIAESLTIYYVSDGDWNGSFTFDYFAKDDLGGRSTSDTKGVVTINVTPLEDPTIANDDFINSTTSAFTVSQDRLLQNDVDPDTAISDMEIIITEQPSEGFVEIIGGQLVFTPSSNFDGQTTFEYIVRANGVDSQSPAVVTVNAEGVVLPPTNPGPETETEEGVEEEDEEVTEEEVTAGNGITPGTEIQEKQTDGRDSANDFFDPTDLNGNSSLEFFQSYVEEADSKSQTTYAYGSNHSDVEINDFYGIITSTVANEVSQFEATLLAGLMWDDLDSAKRDFLMNQVQIGVPAIAASAASFLTVGYLAWIIRGGVLLTTFVSSMPAWSNFDINTVLENAHAGESIEQMVDH